MSIYSESQAKELLAKVVKYSKADHFEANLSGNTGGNIRYARNSVSTSGVEENTTLVVQSVFGKKVGTATINEFDDASLEKVVRRSEELAKLAPENSEYMEPLGPQTYAKSNAYSEATAKITPEYRAQAAFDSIDPSKKNKMIAAGFLQDSAGFNAMMNSKGLFAYNKSSNVDFTITIRTEDGKGSGWASRDFNDVSKLNTKVASQIAIDKAAASASAIAIEPGRYTVILEPAAASGLLQNLFYSLNMRSADEGRSFMSKAGGGTKLGEKMFDERVSFYSDPLNSEVPTGTWSGDGLPLEKTMWVENGVVKNLFVDRFWAKEKGIKPVPRPANGIMVGGNKTTEQLIKETERGILVTRTWYIRMVDPQSLLVTGLTRDGTFYIENGKIKHAVKNFRFNESPIIMLNNIEDLGKPERIEGNLIPPMKIRDFNFTSLSDAV